MLCALRLRIIVTVRETDALEVAVIQNILFYFILLSFIVRFHKPEARTYILIDQSINVPVELFNVLSVSTSATSCCVKMPYMPVTDLIVLAFAKRFFVANFIR
ncbi:hypothetical protein M758_6G128300 [Ceratodon purpureus]|uniref:Uncharacterized protein n=1 Tax=Ceratodon purpureus TaxID=3225 RepID=A0A8T0HHZ6_CERPU|nr:hypothetical protein KC19_6G133600 [Ceratodon purpureus]KAG0613759.1 hypothetical protein M758_6G128300 [Ceratodon purpureus]